MLLNYLLLFQKEDENIDVGAVFFINYSGRNVFLFLNIFQILSSLSNNWNACEPLFVSSLSLKSQNVNASVNFE